MASRQCSETVEQMKNPGEEPPQENEQDQSEICPSKSDEGHVKGDMEKRTLHPLTLLKDDLMKVFKGKGAKTEHEDVKCEDLQSQRAENALSLFKEDFNQFKDDLSSVFRIGLSKDKDKKDDLKRVQSVERTNKLFKKEQRNLPEQNERETRSPEEMNNNTSPPEDSEPHANGSEDTTEETTGRATGSSCQTSSSDDQKPPEAKSALTVKDQEHHLASESDQTDPRESRTIGLLSLLTEDWFKVPGQNRPSTQTENKPTISTSSLLTCDSTQLSVSSSMDKDVARAETKTSQTAEKSVVLMNRLSLLKDDLSNVFRVSLSKEKDNKEDSFRIKVLQTERTDDSFGRDPKPLKSILWDRPLKPEDRQEVKNMLSGRKEEQGDCGFQQNLPEQNKENHGAEKTTIIDRMKRPEDSGQENVSEETMCSSNTGRPRDFFKNLLRREQEDEEVKIMLSENKEAHLDCEHLEQTEQNADAEKDGTPGDRELTLHVSEERAETSEEMMCTSSTGGPRDFLKNLFRRDPKPLRPPEKPEDSQEVRNMLSERKEEQRDPEQYEDREVDLNVSDDNENNQRDSDEREQDDNQDVKVQDSLKTNQKSTISPLMLLKEDFSHFKDDLLSVLRISVPKEKDSNEDAFKIKVLCAERNEEPCKRAEEPDVPELVEETRDTKTKSNSEEGTDRTGDSRVDPGRPGGRGSWFSLSKSLCNQQMTRGYAWRKKLDLHRLFPGIPLRPASLV